MWSWHSRNFVYNLQTLREIFMCMFMILLQIIQHENNFLPTNKHWQNKVRRFLGIFFLRLLDLSIKFGLPETSLNEAPSWLGKQNSE